MPVMELMDDGGVRKRGRYLAPRDHEELAILTMWTARVAVMLNHWASRPQAGPCELAQDHLR